MNDTPTTEMIDMVHCIDGLYVVQFEVYCRYYIISYRRLRQEID